MGELEHVLGATLRHEGVVDISACQYRAQGLGAIGDLLGHVHDVRCDAKGLGAGVTAAASETGDDFVKDQQDVVGGADFANAL